MKQHISAFNGGEVTPLVEGRTDLQSLQRSCRKLRNMIPTSAGAAVRRPSLLHVDTNTDATPIRLIPFVYDTSTRYVIGVSSSNIYVWRDGDLKAQLAIQVAMPTTGAPGFVAFTVDDPNKITHSQVNDILFMASPYFPPLALIRRGETDWDLKAQGSYDSNDGSIGWGRNFWPAVLDESVSQLTATDAVEGWTIQRAISTTTSFIVGGIFDPSNQTSVVNGPNPGFWRLYSGTTSFTGTIVIQGSDTWNGTFRTLYTVTNASTGALTLRQEWFHHYAYMKVSVTRSAGTATFELRHVGSTAAPTVWFGYSQLAPVTASMLKLWSSPASLADWSYGEQFQLGHRRLTQQVSVTVAATTADEFKTSGQLYVLGKYELYTVGSWSGDVYVEAKESTGSWRAIKHVTSNKDQNWSISGDTAGEFLRIRVVKYDASATSSAAVPRFTLVAVDGMATQWGQVIDNVSGDGTSKRVVLMDGADTTLAAAATTSVWQGAWSSRQGYPAAVCIHDQRVYFAGTTERPTTLWASSVNDLFNFRRTGFDDGGFTFEIAANEGNPIQWMVSASRGILAGTSGDEWLFDGETSGITPTNITARRQSRIGSAPIQAVPAAGSTIFIQRGGMHLQEYQFAWESQQFQAVDLSELVKHLTPSGIVSIAFSQNPEPMLWAVTGAGDLLTCTYNRAQEVIAWAKHTTSGTFESVCCTYGETANSDDVWFIVIRDGTRRLEKIDGSFWSSLYNGGALYHMDAAKVKTGAPFTSVTGLTHLEGKTVKVIANGVVRPDAVVASGSVTVPSGTTTAVVGLGFDSELQPMPFELPLATGTVQGRKVQTPAIAARFYRTAAAKYADAYASTYYDAKLDGETSGLVRLAGVGRMNDSCEIAFKSSGALPLNLVAVIPSVQVYGE